MEHEAWVGIRWVRLGLVGFARRIFKQINICSTFYLIRINIFYSQNLDTESPLPVQQGNNANATWYGHELTGQISTVTLENLPNLRSLKTFRELKVRILYEVIHK